MPKNENYIVTLPLYKTVLMAHLELFQFNRSAFTDSISCGET